jgi:hypothetical protein
MDFARLRFTLFAELLRLPAHQFVNTPALHLRVEHFQGSAAGVALVVMGEIGEAFENAEQLLVPRAAPDLHIAGAALGAEWPKARQLVATLLVVAARPVAAELDADRPIGIVALCNGPALGNYSSS